MSDPALMLDTRVGPAGVHWDGPDSARSVLLLGHGAGGGVDARDLVAIRDAAVAAGHAVGRVTQPYRLAGRRAPAPAGQLDQALTDVVAALRTRIGPAPVILGGRSSGARVACRVAEPVAAAGVLALSFPLHPPGRPERSRGPELRAVAVPTLVVQGERDPFGAPAELTDPPLPSTIEVHPIPGANHGFAVRRGDPPAIPAVVAAVLDWLERLVR